MARAIDQFLATIRQAIYGRDVREAIASGIEQCYDDSTASAQKADIEAKGSEVLASIPDTYEDLQNNVDDLKITWNSSTMQKVLYVQGSRDITGKVVLLYTRCTTAELWNLHIGDVVNISGTATGQKYVLAGVKNGGFIFDSGWQTDDKTFVINTDGDYFLNIAATNGTDNITPQSVATITELIDNTSRIAYVESDEDKIKNIIDKNTGIEIIALNKYHIIRNDQNTGVTVDYTAVENSQSVSCAVVTCSAVDKFVFYGNGYINYRLWAFLDSNNKMIDKSDAGAIGNGLVVTVPNNAAKLIININNDGFVFKNLPINVRLNGLSDTFDELTQYTEENVNVLNENVTTLKNGTAQNTGATIIDLTKNSVIQNNQSAGVAVDYTNVESSPSGSCAVADCSPGDTFTFYGSGFINYRLWAFIDSASKMIVNSGMSVTGDGLVVIAPDNAAKIIININNGGTVFAGMSVDERLERIENGTVSESFNVPHCALQGENIGYNLTVMTYNLANYNNDTAAYIPAEKLYNLKRALMRANPDIICTQEDRQYIDSGNTKSSLAYLYNPALPIVYGEGGPCIRSKFMASHNTAWYDYLMLTGNRTLRAALYEINENIKLLVISAHLVAGTTAENIQARSTQYSELLSWANGNIALTSAASGNQAYAPEHTHCIIGIDANTLTATDKTNLSTYANNANFVLGNGGAIGWFYTNWSNGVKTSLDNIICSSNVIINSVEAYGEMYNELYSDHVPVVAHVTMI